MRLYEINLFWLLSANQVRPMEQNPSEAARAVLFSFGTPLQAYPSSLQGSASSFLLSSCSWARKSPSSPSQEFQRALVASAQVCWIKAFFFPVLFTALSKRYCKVGFTHKVQKNLQLAAGKQKSSGSLTLAALLSKQVFCCCISSNSLHI